MKHLILTGILSLFCVIPITQAQAHDSHGKPNYAYKEKKHHNDHKKHYKHGKQSHKKHHSKQEKHDYKHAKKHVKHHGKHVKHKNKHHNDHNAHKKHHTEYVYINGRYYEKRYVYQKPAHHGHGHTYYYVKKPHHGHHNYSFERNFIEILFGF